MSAGLASAGLVSAGLAAPAAAWSRSTLACKVATVALRAAISAVAAASRCWVAALLRAISPWR
ncbi:MAG: hypothetical protein HZA68_18235 [Rhodovulum sp.]|nr:hypothetical protein [Rhodovulum sp.]